MEILLCTRNTAVTACFSSIKTGKDFSITVLPPDSFTSCVKNFNDRGLVYIDISSFQADEWTKLVKSLGKRENLRIGIVDPKQTIKDPGTLFHQGVVDYIPKNLLSEGLPAKRMKEAAEFRPFPEGNNHQEHAMLRKQDWKIVPKGWAGVQDGKEYSFFFLYVEIDMLDEWKKKSGASHIDKIQDIFHRHIESVFSPAGGRIWMWMNHAGVVLFPFNGESCPCIEECVRLILNRKITSIEEYRYNNLISYSMALHLGNTVYRTRGETGEIISDTINFLFHIGKKFAEREHFYVTENTLPFLRPGLCDLFTDAGTFEGVRMFSMKLPKK